MHAILLEMTKKSFVIVGKIRIPSLDVCLKVIIFLGNNSGRVDICFVRTPQTYVNTPKRLGQIYP